MSEIKSIYVDRDVCITAAVCLMYDFYELDDEGKAVLLTNNNDDSGNPDNVLLNGDGSVDIASLANSKGLSIAEMRELALESAKACPFNAIIVKNESGETVWPN